jgi:hypothetical protein
MLLLVTREQILRRIALSQSPFHLLRAQREWENRPSKSRSAELHLHDLCGQSGFWGAYSRLLASSAQPALIKFLVVGAVPGIALRTSTCIDCVRLHQTRRDVSCEWSH